MTNINPESIKIIVSDFFNVPLEKIYSESKKSKFVTPRSIIQYLLKKYTDLSLLAISKQVKRNDHSTAISNIKRVNDLIDTDLDYKNKIIQIEKTILQFKKMAF